MRTAGPTYRIVGPVERVDRRSGPSVKGTNLYFIEGGRTKLHDLNAKQLEQVSYSALRFGGNYSSDRPLHAELPEPLYRYGFGGNHLRRFLEEAVDGPASPTKIPVDDPALMTERIKKLAMDLGADQVGVCELNPGWVYKDHDGPVHRYAIAVAAKHIFDRIQASPSYVADSSSWMAYDMAAKVSIEIAGCIREMGHPARASNTAAEHVIHPPVNVDAGLGEQGRSGYCISPEIGPLFKSGVVTTDLPLKPDGPVGFGLQDFCRKCLKCYKHCPAHAIPMEKSVVRGVEKWQIDTLRCYHFWSSNPKQHFACSACIRVCPWNKPFDVWYHRVTRWFAKNVPTSRPAIIRLDDALGYGELRRRDEEKKEAKVKRIMQLREKGLTLEEIAPKVGLKTKQAVAWYIRTYGHLVKQASGALGGAARFNLALRVK